MKKKFLFITILLIFAILSACTFDLFWGIKLRDKEIYKLRKEYPFIEVGYDNSYVGPQKDLGFRMCLISPDTYLYCKILNNGVEAKEFKDGLVPKNEYYHYFLAETINDTEKIFPSGIKLHICFENIDWIIPPKTGDKIIIPIKISENSDKATIFWDYHGCLYYVTEKGFAISSGRENNDTGYNNGYKADFLVGCRLKKSEKEFELYIKNNNYEYEKSKGKYGFVDYKAYKDKIINELLDKNEILYIDKITKFGIDK